MKRLPVVLLVLALFTPAAFPQSAEQKERLRVFAGWVGIVRGAERNYKAKHGCYGDFDELRNAHLLEALVFGSDSYTRTLDQSEANLVPKSTLFQVTVSEDGQHFRAVIGEECVSVEATETGGGRGYCRPHPQVLPQDGPNGPLIAVPG